MRVFRILVHEFSVIAILTSNKSSITIQPGVEILLKAGSESALSCVEGSTNASSESVVLFMDPLASRS